MPQLHRLLRCPAWHPVHETGVLGPDALAKPAVHIRYTSQLEVFFFHTLFCVREVQEVLVQPNLRTTGRPVGRGVLARLREELVQLWPRPVTKVGGGGHLKQGGSESALHGDCEEPRPARYPGGDGGRT